MTANKTWKVGDLAAETGVSVRALHYYEEIGLLVPSGRTAAGHRLYDEGDVARLQQIVALRGVGLSLEKIAGMLASPDSSPLSVLQLHIQHLHDEVEQRRSLCEKLEVLAQRLVERGSASTADLIEALRWTTTMEPLIDKYYSDDQREYLDERRAMFSEKQMAEVESEWREIFARMRRAMETNVDPADESVQTLVTRMGELIEKFTGGDEGVRDSLGTMWANESAPREMMGSDDELAAYMARARAVKTPA